MKISDLYLVKIFKSNYCKVVFGISLFFSYFLIPKTIFYKAYTIVGIIYIVMFALVLTCILRNIKEKFLLAKTKTYEGSIVGVLAATIGLAALQVCGIGAPVCGATVGAGVLSIIFPSLFISILGKYALDIIFISIIVQFIALYFMNCFKKCIRC